MNRVSIFLAVFFACGCFFSQAQNINTFTGVWEGVLKAGAELPIVFNIRQANDTTLETTMDSPAQGAYGIKTELTKIYGNSILINVPGIKGKFNGVLANDSTIEGKWNQGMDFLLVLNKKEKPTTLKRPQEPRPPFPYYAEEVQYSNANNSISFGGTFTRPEKNGIYPVALLITGSGKQDRDETLFGHKPFAVIADFLTRKGIAVLRVDDRDMGKTTGDFAKATSADFAEDINAGVDYLLTRNDVDKNKIGLMGHSEGGMIAPIVASKRNDIDFVILLAGPGIKITQLMTEQNAAILKSNGVPSQAADDYSIFYRQMLEAVGTATDEVKLNSDISRLMIDWVSKTDSVTLAVLKLDTDSSRRQLKKSIMDAYHSPWLKYFFAFDPGLYLKKLNTKVLALNGEKDIQVLSKSNLAGIKTSLKKGKAKQVVIKELPGLNHLFQRCDKCDVGEYGKLEETFSPIALQEMIDWLHKYVR